MKRSVKDFMRVAVQLFGGVATERRRRVVVVFLHAGAVVQLEHARRHDAVAGLQAGFHAHKIAVRAARCG